MHMMTVADTRQILNIVLDIIYAQSSRNCLQQDARGCFAQRNCRAQDDESDDQGDGGIEVESSLPASEPDKKRSGNNTNIAQRITHDMEEDTAHVEIVVRVTVATAAGLFLGLSVFMLLVVDGL